MAETPTFGPVIVELTDLAQVECQAALNACFQRARARAPPPQRADACVPPGCGARWSQRNW